MPPSESNDARPDERALRGLGQAIRQHRRRLKISATATAEAAGMSRVTLYRIEKGEPSVAMGAYLGAMAALGLVFAVNGPSPPPLAASSGHASQDRAGWIPVRVPLAAYPQLRQIAWHLADTETLSPQEALALYERNARHLNVADMAPEERQLLDALRQVFGSGA